MHSVYVCMYVYMYVQTYFCDHTHKLIDRDMHPTCTYIRSYICERVILLEIINMYVCKYGCMYLLLNVCIVYSELQCHQISAAGEGREREY